jgi:hypothetical protein
MADQISRPMQIVLGVTLLFAVVWFVALRPKPGTGDASAAPTPAASSAAQAPTTTNGILTAPAKARAAVAKSDARSAQIGAASNAAGSDSPSTTSTPAVPAASSAAAPSTSHARPSHAAPAPNVVRGHSPDARLARALAGHRVVAVLVFNPRGADDRSVRSHFGQVTTRHGRVVKLTIPLSRLGHYPTLTKRVQVTESPTVVIFDRAGNPQTLQGYVDPTEVSSRIDDALAVRGVSESAPTP